MEREVRYCTTEDGVTIAYSVEGEGPTVVLFPYMFGSFTLEHLWPDVQAHRRAVGQGRTAIRYDMRGIGASSDATDFSHHALVTDVEAVIEAVGDRKLYLYASLISVPIAIEFAARHSDLIAGIVLTRPIVRGADVMAPDALQALATLAESRWPQAAQLLADFTGRREYQRQVLEMSMFFEQSTSGERFARLVRAMYETTDVSGRLSAVDVPALVLYWGGERSDDPVSYDAARSLASALPQGRLVRLERRPLDDQKRLHEIIDSFIPRAASTAQPAAPLAQVDATPARRETIRTVLFTDLVDHTEMMSRLGDERGRAVLREHEVITREVLKAHDGTEIKTDGDSFMISFGSVTKAVECAIALQRAFAEREGEPLSVRVGLNAGQPIEEDGDLFGATVILASRIAAKAGAGEILVADTVRGLCSGKGFAFADRGEFIAKGIEEPVRVSEVLWRE
jgi:class 3 adenylate cyclase